MGINFRVMFDDPDLMIVYIEAGFQGKSKTEEKLRPLRVSSLGGWVDNDVINEN